MRYGDAGVDLGRSHAVKARLGPLVRSTWGAGVCRLPDGFAGVMSWPDRVPGRGGPELEPEPLLLAASMDGAGTKLHLGLEAGRVADVAADLVYHGANDLLVHGGRPLALLDYIAQERLDAEVVMAVVQGLSRACLEVGAALLGGETAEMPDTYRPGVVDVAGCMVGSVSREELIDGSRIRAGDEILGLCSSGLHTNGYSLARRILARSGLTAASPLPHGEDETVMEALLRPHRWYGPALVPELPSGRLHGLAHVTGGGIAGNLVRVLPEGVRARIRAGSWPRPGVFRWLIEAGEVQEEEARATFNLGIGMVVVCSGAAAPGLSEDLARAGEQVHRIGEVVAGERGVEWIEEG